MDMFTELPLYFRRGSGTGSDSDVAASRPEPHRRGDVEGASSPRPHTVGGTHTPPTVLPKTRSQDFPTGI